MDEGTHKRPTLLVALIPIIFLIGILSIGVFVYGQDAHILLAISACFAGLVGKYLGYSWKEMEEQIMKSIGLSMQASFILMTVGILVAVWIASGVVPTMIYYGLMVIHPTIFLATVLIVCSVVSLTIGSSWSTAATVGIAFMGIGIALGVPAPMVAGAVISGAYFGDKMSPLSDTTNLASAVTGVNLFDHIRHMMYTTGPALLIAFVLYVVMGFQFGGGEYVDTQVAEITAAISSAFNVNLIMLLPVVFVIVMIVKKIPALPGLWVGIFMGVLFKFIFQLGHYEDFNDAMGTLLTSMNWGFESATGHEVIDSLFSGGGLQGMLYSVSIIFCSMAFAGIIEKTKCLEVVTQSLLSLAKSIGSLVLVSNFSAFFTNVITGDQYLSVVLPGRMYKGEFEKRGYDTKNFSRCIEDSGTMTSPLVPWNACALYMSATLGVATVEYLPYVFLNLATPIISIILGFTGITMVKLKLESKNNDAAAT